MASPNGFIEYTEAKLRSSCDQCAVAKVGCTKEKPACARCVKRGITCRYSATKRVKRVERHRRSTSDRDTGTPSQHQRTFSSPNVNTQVSTGLISRATSSSSLASPDMTNTSTVPSLPTMSMPATPSWTLSSFETPDIFAGMLQPRNPSYTSTEESDINDFLASLDAFSDPTLPLPEQFNFDSMDLSGETSGKALADIFGATSTPTPSQNLNTIQNPSSSSLDLLSIPQTSSSLFPIQRDTSLESLSTLFQSPGSFDNTTSNSEAASSSASDSFNFSSCGCMSRVCSLLAKSMSSRESPVSSSRPDTGVHALLSYNERRVATIKDVLESECSCFDDGNVLSMVPIVILSILSCYATVASGTQEQHSNDESNPSQEYMANQQSGNDIQNNERQRTTVEEVLSRLADVQFIINKVSIRLKNVKPGVTGSGNDKAIMGRNIMSTANPADKNVLGSLLIETEFTKPFSPSLAAMLEAEMRKRLQYLARASIEWLRR